MGNNEAYSIFEATVVGVYNLGKLDKDVLGVLMEPYRNTDIDAGGKGGLTGDKDGLEVEEICIKIMGRELPPRPNLPKDHRKWTEAQDEANEHYQNEISRLFHEVTREFGW